MTNVCRKKASQHATCKAQKWARMRLPPHDLQLAGSSLRALCSPRDDVKNMNPNALPRVPGGW